MGEQGHRLFLVPGAMLQWPDRLRGCGCPQQVPRDQACQVFPCLETAAGEEPVLEKLSLKTLRTVGAGTEAEGQGTGS